MHEIIRLVESLADDIDKKIFGGDVRVARRQLDQRRITLADSGKIKQEEVRAALKELTLDMPEAAGRWLEERLGQLREDLNLDVLTQVFWEMSIVTIPQKYRQPRLYTHLANYRVLVMSLFDRFLWNLVKPKGLGMQREIYRKMLLNSYAQIMAYFNRRQGKMPKLAQLDILIDQAFEDTFEPEKAAARRAADLSTSVPEVGELKPAQDPPPRVKPASPTVVALPRLVTAPPQTGNPLPPISPPPLPNAPSGQHGIGDETWEGMQRDLERLRGQVDMLTRRINDKMRQMAEYLACRDESVICANWLLVLQSPWHITELSWHLDRVPTQEVPKALRDIVRAVSFEKKSPNITRFRKILESVLKRYIAN